MPSPRLQYLSMAINPKVNLWIDFWHKEVVVIPAKLVPVCLKRGAGIQGSLVFDKLDSRLKHSGMTDKD